MTTGSSDAARRAAAALFYGDLTVKTLLDSITEGSVVVDSESTIVHVNRAGSELLGYDSGELLGESLSKLVPEELVLNHERLVSGFMASPDRRPMGTGRDLLLQVKTKDGSRIPVDISINHLDTGSGRYGIAVFTDIRKRLAAEERTTALLKNLEEFAGFVAHDLRGTLAEVSGIGHFLVEHTEGEAQEMARQLIETHTHLAEVVSGLLTFAKSTSHDKVVLQDIDMNGLMQQTMRRFWGTPEFEERVTTSHLAPMRGVPDWLEEVYFNLLANARDHAGPDASIRVENRTDEKGRRCVVVADDGPGVALQHEDAIFEPGQSTKDGSGLGLHIIRRILERVGGDVQYRTALGGGAEFWVYQPPA